AWLPGAPAPWASLPEAARGRLSVAQVVGAVLPGEPPFPTVPAGWRLAAVLVALFEEAGQARVVLTRRSDRLRSHRGEVSFPGGQVEPGEALAAAACREAREEIGLAPETVTLVGHLDPLATVSSRRVLVPVVGVLPGRPEARRNPAEVARVFDVALVDLLADGVFHEERWPARAGWPEGLRPRGDDGRSAHYPVWFFDVAGETVWGATARVLVDLLGRSLGLGSPTGQTG
ncbi:NUDIX hydrolase, partial [Aciditerrimonas ferrireducens]